MSDRELTFEEMLDIAVFKHGAYMFPIYDKGDVMAEMLNMKIPMFYSETDEADRKALEHLSNDWKSILSAPTDGTMFLGFNVEYGVRETHWRLYGEGSIAKIRFEKGEGPSGYWDWTEPQNNWGSSWQPTHWKPLELQWISTKDQLPNPGDLIVKRWASGSVWAGHYYPPIGQASRGDSGFDFWIKLPK